MLALFTDFLFIGIGLSMDAFAVSVCKGLGMTKVNKKQAGLIALFFGGFQALMPFLGWAAGSLVTGMFGRYAPWIAFVLLFILGLKMIIEAVKEKSEEGTAEKDQKLDLKELFVMAVATSIDALAVGVSFGLMYDLMTVLFAIAVIGIVTAIICIAGVYIGNVFGMKFEKRAQIAGGVILILIGLKILLEGLGIIAF